MGYIVEISENKVEHLADTVGKMLRYGGMAMQCIEELREGHGHMDERGGYGRFGMRENDMTRHDGYDNMDERYDHMDERNEMWHPYMDERRGRSMSTGRYMRR